MTEFLWLERPAPTRGPKPSLTLESLAAAAVALADSEGLNAVSMERVAAALGLTKMSLYRYVPGKAELVALMFETALGPPPPIAASEWQAGLGEWSTHLLDAYLKHTWALEATVGARPIGPNEMEWMEQAAAILGDTGLGGAQRLDTIAVLAGHARMIAQQSGADTGPEGRIDRQMVELLKSTSSRFPGLAAAVDEAAASGLWGQAFKFGLGRILDGLEVAIAGREAKLFPTLPCADIDISIAFYEALGFSTTYRQTHPNPYAVVARGDIQLHLFGVDGFDPENSLGNVIVATPDLDALYESFAAGLRAAYGKLPSAGIPRILRPRRRFGTVRGFSVVDPGGNWLRFSLRGDTEEEAKKDKSTGLARWIDNAARHGDARGNDKDALGIIEEGLKRYPKAPPPVRVRALLYRAELAVRLQDRELAGRSLEEALAIPLTGEQQSELADEIAHAREIVAD